MRHIASKVAGGSCDEGHSSIQTELLQHIPTIGVPVAHEPLSTLKGSKDYLAPPATTVLLPQLVRRLTSPHERDSNFAEAAQVFRIPQQCWISTIASVNKPCKGPRHFVGQIVERDHAVPGRSRSRRNPPRSKPRQGARGCPAERDSWRAALSGDGC